MPDLLKLIIKRWKLILTLTAGATIIALVISLLLPKEFLATVTAIPANSALSDKARIFNNNIETLYPEIGTTDELDRIEGAAKLDTVYMMVAQKQNLASHYGFSSNNKGIYDAAIKLKKATSIRRSAYGELKINVWDEDPVLAAMLANDLLLALNIVYQQVNSTNNNRILSQLQAQLAQKQNMIDSLEKGIFTYEEREELSNNTFSSVRDTTGKERAQNKLQHDTWLTSLRQQVADYQAIIPQFELVLSTTIQPLIVVENARPAIYPDKPRIIQTVLFALGASLLFSIFLAIYMETKKA